jgi:hypothetical protein
VGWGCSDHCVTNEMDTLATALYVKTDDMLRDSPGLAPWRPRIGIAPELTVAELVTLAMMQALLGFTSEARWLRYARAHLGHRFPGDVKRPETRLAVDTPGRAEG